jgi:hypothetical protein
MSPDQVSIELSEDRTTHPLEALTIGSISIARD